MRILFDHNVPRFLRRRIHGHEVSTASRENWDTLSNGRLLAAAEEAGFDVLVTRDQVFLDPNKLAGRNIAVALLVAQGQTRGTMEGLIDRFGLQIEEIVPGTLIVIEAV